jgi:hypothetical protein
MQAGWSARWLRHRSALMVLACTLIACRQAERPPAAPAQATEVAPDSLVATGPDGTEVWFTLARAGHSPDGSSCVERGLEIRRGADRIQVPLLYTGTVPVLLDSSTMRAQLWNHCRPVDTYLVDMRTGRPVRQRSGGT